MREYQASAYSLDGEELLYVERHVEFWRSGRLAERSVTYEDASGDLIAEKVVSYGEDASAPSFEMTDYRIGHRESARVESDLVSLASGPAGERSRARAIAMPEGAVIDAGFDAFMRDNFEQVVAGNRLEVDFAVPAARRFFRLQLLPEGPITFEGRPAYRVEMKPASRLLRLLLDPIDLTYDADGQLLEYRGVSNVCDEDGDRYKARIVFDYGSGSDSSTTAGAAR